MDEQKTEQVKEDVKEEVKEVNVLEQAEAIAKRIEEGNKRSEELIKRHEDAIAKSILGGRSVQVKPKSPEEILAEKQADRVNKIINFRNGTS